MAQSPLAGTRVLDLSRVVAGPFAGRMLSDLGADVVKLEPPEGDLTRVWGENRHGRSGFYFQQNTGKRNISVDLKAPGAPELVARLAEVADVLIENFRPGVLGRLGLGWDELSRRNPRLVMLSVTGFGQTGVDAGRQAYAPVIHAEAGVLARQAELTQAPPVDLMLSVADYNAALHGLSAVLAALLLRERTGTGQHIDISMLHTMLATDEYVHHVTDDSPVRKLGGEVWDAVGGPILIAAEFRYAWFAANNIHGVADPTPPGADLPEKIRARRDAFRAWMSSFTDRDELKLALEKANLAWADVRAGDDVLAAPSVVERGMVTEVDDGAGGRRRVIDSPYRFSDADSRVRGAAPARGEHNETVLSEWLGATSAEVESLVAAGVLIAEDRAPEEKAK
jgi:crotonobetainyl-CoA:carnitine CoA-transferase CaiB-like acyl-CoA transferase